MPRLSAKVIANREAITTRNFIAGMTMDQANAELVKLDGMKMNPYRLKEIFDECTGKAGPWKEPHYKNPMDEKPLGEPVKVLQMDVPAPSIFDLPPAKMESTEGCMTIRELIKALEAGQFPAR